MLSPLTRSTRLVTALAGATLLAACGGGSGSVTSEGGGSASGSASASVIADDCPESDGPSPDQAERTVEVTLTDYAIELGSDTVPAGVTTFSATNAGEEPHELAFLPGGGEVPLTSEGAPDEEALEAAGAFELEAFAPGETCDATYELDPGTYTLFCIVSAPDGETHADKGMVTTLEVA